MDQAQREPERRWNFSELRAVGFGNYVDLMQAPRIEKPYLHPRGESFALAAQFPSSEEPAITREEGDQLVYAARKADDHEFAKQEYDVKRDRIHTGTAFALPEYFPAKPGHSLVFLPDGTWWYGAQPEKKLEEIAGEQAQAAREKLLERDMLGALKAGIHALNARAKTVDTALLVYTMSVHVARYVHHEVMHLEARRYEPDSTVTQPTDEELKAMGEREGIAQVMAYGREQEKSVPWLPIPFDPTTPEEAKRLYEQGNKFVQRSNSSPIRPDHFSALAAFQQAFWLAPLDLEIGAQYSALATYVTSGGLERARNRIALFEWESPVHDKGDVFSMFGRVLAEQQKKEKARNPENSSALQRRTQGILSLLNQPKGIDPDDDFA